MDPSLLRLMEDLVESLDERDSGEPDAASREAARRIRQLEAELTRRLAATAARDEELVAIN